MVKAKTTEIVTMDENGAISNSIEAIAATVMTKDGKTYLYLFYGSDKKVVEDIFLLKGFKATTWITSYHLVVVCAGFDMDKPGAAMLQAAERLYRVAYSED